MLRASVLIITLLFLLIITAISLLFVIIFSISLMLFVGLCCFFIFVNLVGTFNAPKNTSDYYFIKLRQQYWLYM